MATPTLERDHRRPQLRRHGDAATPARSDASSSATAPTSSSSRDRIPGDLHGLPLIRGVLLSFTATKLVNPAGGRPVGMENYEYLLSSDKFWSSVITTLLYTLFTVVFSVGIGTAGALLLNTAFKGRGIIRAIATIPWAVPTVAAALIFVWIYNNEQGILNRTTSALGLGEHGWLVDPKYGLFAVDARDGLEAHAARDAGHAQRPCRACRTSSAKRPGSTAPRASSPSAP